MFRIERPNRQIIKRELSARIDSLMITAGNPGLSYKERREMDSKVRETIVQRKALRISL